jgi:hypothetical protein
LALLTKQRQPLFGRGCSLWRELEHAALALGQYRGDHQDCVFSRDQPSETDQPSISCRRLRAHFPLQSRLDKLTRDRTQGKP